MAQLAVGPLLAQPAREGADAEDHNETDDSLMEFVKCAVALRNVLYQDSPLNTTELYFIDNHFQVLRCQGQTTKTSIPIEAARRTLRRSIRPFRSVAWTFSSLMHMSTRSGMSPLSRRLTIELMRLAPSTSERVLRQLTAYHECGHIRGSRNEFLGPFAQFPTVLYLADIPFHVLRAPAP
jgi:hypothetical protein